MPILVGPGVGSTSTTTLDEWIAEVRYHLNAHAQGAINTLANPYTAGSGTLVFTQALGRITAGSVLSLGENTFYVQSTNEGTKTATVIAGWEASKDANAAAGAYVRVNPRFTDHRIVKALNQALAAVTSPDNGLFRAATYSIDYTNTAQGYDLSVPGFIRVLEVRRQDPGAPLGWPRLRSSEWDVIELAPTADFASGRALRVKCATAGYAVQAVVAAEFTPLSGGSTLVNTCGIPDTAQDIIPLAAAISIMAGREVGRNTLAAQGDTRRAEEVPQGAVGRSYGGLVGQLRARLKEESSRLRGRWGFSK